MSIYQETITLKSYKRGFHLITDEIQNALSKYNVQTGMANIFIKHTSASISINENADPSVRVDMESFYTDIADDKSYYIHTYEGRDDMPAHIKSSILGQSVTVPITNARLNLGTWQGIYFGEHRDYAGERKIILTIYGE
jgi:secondary thiamine-phosphate synthase enzyme